MAVRRSLAAGHGVRSGPRRIVMLLENFTYPEDTRVRNEAESLAGAGHRVTVLAPRGPGQPARERLRDVEVRRYRTVWAGRSPWSYVLEYGIAHLQLLARALVGAAARREHAAPQRSSRHARARRCSRPGWSGGRVVYDMHDSGPELFEAKFGASIGTGGAARRPASGHRLRPSGDRDQRVPARAGDRARPMLLRRCDGRAQRSRASASSPTRRPDVRASWTRRGSSTSGPSTCRTACSNSPSSCARRR